MNKHIWRTFAGTVLLLILLVPGPAFAKGVVLNFSEVDISTMVKFISDLTGKNFIMDDRVKGKISIFSPARLTADEAFNVFTSVLELKGFTLIHVGKVYKIIPIAAAKQAGMNLLSEQERGPVNDMYVARVVTLEHIPASEAVTFLQPVVSKDGYISSFGPANMVLVVDSSANIQKILGIIEMIDTNQRREKAELIFLKSAAADSVAKVAQEWLKSRDKSSRPAAQAAGGVVIADTRLNALIVFGSDKDKEDVKKLVAMIDVASPATSSKVNVYYLENADATEIAKVLDGVVKGSMAPTTPGVAAAVQQSPFEGGKITITADKASNALVIMASPTDYQNLLAVIQKLDKRRRQVFVQAVIAEVSLDKLKDLGVQWGMIGGASDGQNVTAIGGYDPFGAVSQVTSLLQGLSAFTTGGTSFTIPNITGTPANFAVVLKALNSNGAVNILSTPTILTSDNKEAMITVGQNVPLLTSNTVITGGASQQSVERKDVGITLKITPQISEGEYVKLDIDQDISSVAPKGEATDIVLSTRKAKTSVVVKDMDTVVIAGLIQDQDQETVSKIPLLGDIPLFGWLFKTTHKARMKTNLMIVLTPRIIRGAQELAEVSQSQKASFTNALQSDQPFDLGKELQQKP